MSKLFTTSQVSFRYAALFSSVIALSADEEEGMLFVKYVTFSFCAVISTRCDRTDSIRLSSLQRMRAELNRLIAAHAQRIKDPSQSAVFTSQMCDSLLTMLSVSLRSLNLISLPALTLYFYQSGERLNIHPKAQAEVAFWREREEEARRRMASTRR